MMTTARILEFDSVSETERIGDYFTLRGAAQVLNVPEGRLSRLIHMGRIKGRRVGWIWVIHRLELENLVKDIDE